MKVRVIIQSQVNGENESVIFSKDFVADVEDFVIPENIVNFDNVIDMDDIQGFPWEYTLQRV